MKKILYLLLFVNFIFASESQYPLGFSFEEDSLFLSGISVKEDENNSTVLSIIFHNNNDNIFILSNNIVELPGCNIRNLPQMKDILNSNLSTSCKRIFSLNGEKYKEIKIDDFLILLYRKKKSNFKTAFIFKDKEFTSSVTSDINDDKFIKLLLSLKAKDKDLKNINDYIYGCKKYLAKGFLNRSFRQIVSAFILDPKNKNLYDLYHILMKTKARQIDLDDSFFHYKFKRLKK